MGRKQTFGRNVRNGWKADIRLCPLISLAMTHAATQKRSQRDRDHDPVEQEKLLGADKTVHGKDRT